MQQKTGDDDKPVKKDCKILIVGTPGDLKSILDVIGMLDMLLNGHDQLTVISNDVYPNVPSLLPSKLEPVILEEDRKPEINGSVHSTRGAKKKIWQQQKPMNKSIRRKH